MKVYVSTETYMLTDKSPNFIETWEFLDRRLSDATAIKEAFDGNPGAFASSVGTGISSIASIFSPSNLSMNDDFMRKMQEDLLNKNKGK